MVFLSLFKQYSRHLSHYLFSPTLRKERLRTGSSTNFAVFQIEKAMSKKHTLCLAFWRVLSALVTSFPGDRDASWVHDSS